MSDEDSQNYVVADPKQTYNLRNGNADFVNKAEAKFQAEQNRDLARKLVNLQKVDHKFRGFTNRTGYELIKEGFSNGQQKRSADGR